MSIENVINIRSSTEIEFQAADIAEVNLKISRDLGELELGKLDQEYFNDPDLKSILQETELDTEKMKDFEKEKLYLIYSVIYSERFEVGGKIQREVTRKLHDVMFRLSAPLPTSANSSNINKRDFQPASPISISTHPISSHYYMASVCSRYNARSDWLSAA